MLFIRVPYVHDLPKSLDLLLRNILCVFSPCMAPSRPRQVSPEIVRLILLSLATMLVRQPYLLLGGTFLNLLRAADQLWLRISHHVWMGCIPVHSAPSSCLQQSRWIRKLP